jgi:hypothetical protein
MANAYKLYRVCPDCKGTQLLGTGAEFGAVEQRTCTTCSGNKVVLWGYCTEAIADITEIPS